MRTENWNAVAQIVSIIAIEALGTIVDCKLRAQSTIEAVAVRQIADVSERITAHRKNSGFIGRIENELVTRFFNAFPAQVNGIASALSCPRGRL